MSEELPELKQRLKVLEEEEQSYETRTRELEVSHGRTQEVREQVSTIVLRTALCYHDKDPTALDLLHCCVESYSTWSISTPVGVQCGEVLPSV